VPYSNDMSHWHRAEDDGYAFRLPLLRDREILEWEPDQRQLTRRYTEAAVEFIDAHHQERFFLYLAHSMPHTPLYASDTFEGKSAAGLYGDVIEELDWSTGEVIAALERHGILDRTLLLFLSDNGPNVKKAGQGGSAGPLRGGKGMDTEGGHRVPAVLRFPALVPPGTVSDEVLTAMDVLPTVAALAGATTGAERAIDGRDVRALWAGASGDPGTYLYYGRLGDLAGVRRGPWKLALPGGELYDLDQDPGETSDLSDQHTDVAAGLQALARELDGEIEDQKRPVRVVSEEVFDPKGT
jgi:arylsulfatase A